ncbi:helix-turn-helix domain-containing protein, partial [Enterococcus faecium]
LFAFFLLTISVSYATQDVLEIPAASMHMVQLLGSPIKEIIYQLTSFYQIKLTFLEYLYLYTSIQNLSVFFKTFVTIANPFVQESFLKEALQKNPSLYKDVKRLTIE